MKILTLKAQLLCLFLTVLSFHHVVGQTGPGGVGNATDNSLWLRADSCNCPNNYPISNWSDQSGNFNHVRQDNADQQPILRRDFMNGYPAIEFDNVSGVNRNDFLWGDSHPSLDNTNGLTIFSVTRRNIGGNARSIISKRVNLGSNNSYMFFFWNSNFVNADIVTNNNRFTSSPTAIGTGTNNILTMWYDGSLVANQRARIYRGEQLLVTANESSASIPANDSPIVLGATHIGDNRAFGGYMAEVILYRRALNPTERIIVNNYLSSKYDIALSTNDVYTMDQPANGNFDHEVAGIGRIGSDIHDEAQGSGMIRILNPSNLDDGEFFMWGHNNRIAEAVVFDDVPAILEARFERVWRGSEVTLAGSPADVGAIDLRFDLRDLDPIDENHLGLLVDTNNDGLFSDETPIFGATHLGGSIYEFSGVTEIENARRFTLGTTNARITPLPVELLTWEGDCVNGKTVLRWSTATEKNNEFFTIESSLNAKDWKEVARVKGAGDSDEILNYEFGELRSTSGMVYFRLKQTDYDGTFEYSKVIGVNCGNIEKVDILVHPNPSKGIVNIDLMGKTGETIILDTMGQMVSNSQVIEGKGSFDLQGLPAGVYVIRTILDRELITKKLIIER
jgi:hypothetical protein